MQNKGAFKFFAILFAIVCLYQLSFTFITSRVESKANRYANSYTTTSLATDLSKGNEALKMYLVDSITKARENYYLDSMANEVVFNILLKKYTYKDCKEREINLGLDLKGGMNVTMEVSIGDIVTGLSGNSQNPTFLKAIEMAHAKQKSSQKDFVTLFGESIEQIDPNFNLASIFLFEFKDKGITANSSNSDVIDAINKETSGAFDRTFNILRTRIDKFGVTQPNVQKIMATNRILVELPGVKDPERVRKLLQGTAQLEFWETYRFNEVFQYFGEANNKLASLSGYDEKKEEPTASESEGTTSKAEKDTTSLAANDTTKSLLEQLKKDSTDVSEKDQNFAEYAKKNPLYAVLNPAYEQRQGQYYPGQSATVGFAQIKDTAKVNQYLRITKNLFPRDMKLAWTHEPRVEGSGVLELIALKTTNRDLKAALGGEVINEARQDYDQNGRVEVSMSMNSEGAKIWKRLTGENIGRQIAIVLDDYVYSAPNVNSEIPNGQSSITGGNTTVEEAQDLANVLKAGKLPARAHIVEEAIVGPSLGAEAVNAGLWSFIAAFILTLIYMLFYYNRAGVVANIALFTNVFFVFGVLASIGAVLTLPGIAGIVLTIGMDVDKNVIIYERIREEIRAGKGLRLAIMDGYKHGLTAIIDSNIITLLTGIILFVFGSGPVQGFATTLIIGIISSLFCAIFITKLVFVWMLDRNMSITLWNDYTKDILTKTNYDFIGLRKVFYIVSASLVVVGVASLSFRGLSYGIDFLGGRSYVVRFDRDVRSDEVRLALAKVYGSEPEVKTFGAANQVKITTSYMIDDISTETDSVVEAKLYDGVKSLYKNPISANEFLTHSEHKGIGKLSSQKVQPTIAYNLLVKAYYAVFFSLLIIFAYIAFRFRKWQWGLGGVVSLFHDTFIVVTIFSLLYGVLPFSLDIDQHFIAAILTIIGYSIMDTVIIFDRIREYMNLHPKRDLHANMNAAINSTLSRTLNTSGITFMVLLAMFIFGGEVIRGFAFALLVGVAIGTYSSIFNATPIAYDLIVWQRHRRERKKQELEKTK